MQVKIFTANGYAEIQRMENDVNAWLEGATHIEKMDTALCQVADKPEGERWQFMTVTILYR